MKTPEAISRNETLDILKGSREMPRTVVESIMQHIDKRQPLVNPAKFDEFAAQEMAAPYEFNPAKTADKIVRLGMMSVEMAYMLAGDGGMPRLRRLGEHNQSVRNVLDYTFGHQLTCSGDQVLGLNGLVFQDDGKSLGVAIDGNSRNQKAYNLAVTANILHYSDALSDDVKEVIRLLNEKDMVGTAIRKYHDKNQPFEEVMDVAEGELNELRWGFPSGFKDRADHYVDIAFRSDTGAHTQHVAAQYYNFENRRLELDVTSEDRKNVNAKGLPMTLDRLYSEEPPYKNRLRFHRPRDLRIVRRLFPSIYTEGDK